MVPRRVSLQSRKQLEAIGSPVRLEILRHLQAEGELTVFELARRMGRSADGLYYHVRRLLEAGVLVRSGSRPAGRREEALLSLAGSPLELTIPSDGDGPGTLLETGRSLLREVEQNLRALVPPAPNGNPAKGASGVARTASGADATGSVVPARPDSADLPGGDGGSAAAGEAEGPSGPASPGSASDSGLPLLARMTARLPDRAVAEVRRHLDAVASIFASHKEPAHGPASAVASNPQSEPASPSAPQPASRHELTVFLLEVASGRRRD